MKIRADFVTNSSSSSYIISNATTHEVCEYMLTSYINDPENFSGYHTANKKKQKAQIQKAINFVKKSDLILPTISFPWGVNEETYIMEIGFFRLQLLTTQHFNWLFDDQKCPGSLTYIGECAGIDIISTMEFFDCRSMQYRPYFSLSTGWYYEQVHGDSEMIQKYIERHKANDAAYMKSPESKSFYQTYYPFILQRIEEIKSKLKLK